MVQHQHCKRSSLCLKIKINCYENIVICALNVSWITQKIKLVGLLDGQVVLIYELNYLVVIQIHTQS